MDRAHIAGLIAIATCCWLLALWVQGYELSLQLLAPFGFVVGATAATLSVFNSNLWHWPAFAGWLVKRPLLAGTWQGTLHSDYIDPATGRGIDPILCFVVIRQNFRILRVRLYTPQSSSDSLSASILQNDDGTFELVSVYQNTPSPEFREASAIHRGSLVVHVGSRSPKQLEGQYWTDRKTTGKLHLRKLDGKLISSFQEGEAIDRPAIRRVH